MKLKGTVDCGKVLPGNIERAARIGDVAVVRMFTKNWEHRFVVGAVTSATTDGQAQIVATARNRPSWEYAAHIHVGDQKRLQGRTAEQIAGAIPQAFDTLEEARTAILDELQAGKR